MTGNASADLDTQLPAIIAYNNAHNPNAIPMLNAITDPVQAADFYSSQFEVRPFPARTWWRGLRPASTMSWRAPG